MVLGMGPHKGLTKALLRLGVRNGRKLVYRVLEVAHRWVYDTFGDPPAVAARPHISVHWAGGINTALLVGKDDNPRERARQWTPYTCGGRWGQCAGDNNHMWRTIHDHMIHTNKGAYLTSWNAKVQRVWVSWWGGTSGKY